jgi:glycosyltransferase involved in cell wall biosynthesis
MKIAVVGTRGIPNIPGGVETHCQELYPRLAAMGYDITVMRRTCYVNDSLTDYHGVKLVNVYAPRVKSVEAVVHTYLATLKARLSGADIIHVHAVGPSLVVPFARMLGMKVVMTHHGPDYNRSKWGNMARKILRLGERWGVCHSNRVIVISGTIAKMIAEKYGRTDSAIIFNGVNRAAITADHDFLDRHGIVPQKYLLAVGRLVEEKGFHDLIAAYKLLGDKSIKLVIAGDSDHEDAYSHHLKHLAADAGVIMTGYVTGAPLQQLLSHAALFLLPSYHEGLPITLLEAMSYHLDVAVSDIPANRLPQLLPSDLFPVASPEAIADVVKRKLSAPTHRTYDLTPYDWENIARQTAEVYKSL